MFRVCEERIMGWVELIRGSVETMSRVIRHAYKLVLKLVLMLRFKLAQFQISEEIDEMRFHDGTFKGDEEKKRKISNLLQK
jgi:hypothetical protein